MSIQHNAFAARRSRAETTFATGNIPAASTTVAKGCPGGCATTFISRPPECAYLQYVPFLLERCFQPNVGELEQASLNVRLIRLLGDPEAFTRTGVILIG
jgi:hypothetical protein